MEAYEPSDAVRELVENFVQIDSEKFDQFFTQIASSPRTTTGLKEFKDRLQEIDSADGAVVYTMLSAICQIAANRGESILSFADRLLDYFTRNPIKIEEADQDNETVIDPSRSFSHLKEWIATSKDFVSEVKAAFLFLQAGRVFHGGQIFSDIRPIFDPYECGPQSDAEVAGSVVGGVITHTLRIDYLESGEFFQRFYTLKAADLEDLKKVIDRAQQKGNALSRIVENSIKVPVRSGSLAS